MLYFNTVLPLLENTLKTIVKPDVFLPFRLVGGTALSLRLGHRMSDDIDLFTDELYGKINFEQIETYFKNTFSYVQTFDSEIVGMGKSYRVGESFYHAVKLDLFYTDPFIRNSFEINGIRMADIEDIIAMKIDIIQRGGRKKDFWDLHELIDKYPLSQMIALHQERYPYAHDADLILSNLKKL